MTTQSRSLPLGVPERVNSRWWVDLTRPALSDFLFLGLLLWLFIAGIGWLRLMLDGDTGVHIRIGDQILATGSAPVTDPFSFTAAGRTWYAWEWLSDVAFAALHQSMGLRGVAVLSGLVISLTLLMLLRMMLWRGANWMVALPLLFSAVSGTYLNYLARPHLFTMLLLLGTVWMIEADRRRTSARLWMVAPLTALWANLHGGFFLLFPVLAILVAGLATEGMLWREHRTAKWAQAWRYGTLGVVCAAASLANPYGWQLHAHIYESLQSKWLMDFSREFHSPSFRNEFYYHLMFLLFAGLASATVLVQKRRLADAGIIVFLAYATLTSARHGSLYVLVATPWIAELASEWLMRWTGAQSKKSAGGTLHALALEKQPAFARLSLWTAVFAACLFLPLPLGTFPTDIKPEMAPDQLVQRNRQLLQGSRVFSDDEVGDYLIYRNYPRQRVFFDGRSDFYGEALANDYVALLGGGRKWREIAGRFDVDAMLIDEGSALAAQVASSSEWTFVDKQAAWVLYRKEPQQTAAAARQ